MSKSHYPPASLWRRMAALVYDGLLMFAVLIVIGATTLPFTSGLGIDRNNIIFKVYVFGAVYFYLGWFWTHGGQTLGMRAWKLRLLQYDDRPVVWHLALFYYLVSLPMWGFLIFTIAVNAGMMHTPEVSGLRMVQVS